jgi:hypothetical protein
VTFETAGAAFSIAVVCEAAADFVCVTCLCDRRLVEVVEWLDEDWLAAAREYVGPDDGTQFFSWKKIPELAKALNIRAYGHFDGEPGAPDALAARRALFVAKTLRSDLDAVILSRDADSQPERLLGLRQAANETSVRCAIAFAISKRECWILAAFIPRDEEERRRHQGLIAELGFDPTLQPEELDAQQSGAKRDAKRVLSILTHGDSARERSCLEEEPLEALEARGTLCGLAAYLRDIDTSIVPLF